MTQTTLIFGTFLAPALYKTCLYITEYIERCVGIPTLLLSGEELDDFEAGALDAGFISGPAYVHLTHRHPSPVELIVAPVLQGTHHQRTPHTLSDIVVRKDSTVTTLEDLRGGVGAFCTQGDQKGISDAECLLLYETFFEQIPFKERKVTRSHTQSLRLVLDRTVDAAAIDARLLDIIFDQSTKMAAQLRIISSFSASTVSPVVVSSHVDSLLRQRIQEALLVIHQHPFFAQRLQEGSIERFLPVTDEHYRGIRDRYRRMNTHIAAREENEQWSARISETQQREQVVKG